MHPAEILIPISSLLLIFGIFYLFFTTRNKQRLALIEKGLDASIFHGKGGTQIRRLSILNIALTAMGIGLGIVIGIGLYSVTGEEAVYPASIFFMAGAGLLTSFMMSKKYIKE